MNKEIIVDVINNKQKLNPDVFVAAPNSLSAQETAEHVLELLQTIYVDHAITNNPDQLVEDLKSGKVLTWLAFKNDQAIATASLIDQGHAWELGRAVSLDRGNGIGQLTMLKRVLHHIENHLDKPLIGEVRVSDEFMGIPSGQATQRIAFGTVGLVPHAIAPLFSHGEPTRNELFALSSSHLEPCITISEMVSDAIGTRPLNGEILPVSCIQQKPFRLIVPDNQGGPVEEQIFESKAFLGCTLFAIEATDENLPLIGLLGSNKDLVVCGVDNRIGDNGHPIILIATLGRNVLLAPVEISEVLPQNVKEDLKQIASQFNQ